MPDQNKFPRRERLTRPRDFLDAYRHGNKRVGRYLVCYMVRRDGQGRKIGLTVSRKVGNAVVRNRVKRYIREAYRTQRLEVPEDAHIVVVARKAAARLSYAECAQAVHQGLGMK